ncbi:MAG TPA: oligogalacturonate lyase family protein [Opitutaceae bacterium]|nr:oligogalacturonate lyase family protein [Opitutaceae bacterium]
MRRLGLCLLLLAGAALRADELERPRTWIDSASGHRVVVFPRSWIDPDTGHRVTQLSTEPGSACLYFTQYCFTAGGAKMVMTTPRGIDLVALRTGEIEHVFQGADRRVLQTGRRSGAIYYTSGGWLCTYDPATRETRQRVKLPAGGAVFSVNSDETLVAGSLTVGGERRELSQRRPPQPRGGYQLGDGVQLGDISPSKHAQMDRRFDAHLPMVLFTLDLRTGAYRELLRTTDWIDHFQFSPTDPGLLMYAHEGRQWRLDRIWLIRADQERPEPRLVHQRTMKMELAVHEYWSADGRWIWYDLQKPISEDCWIAGYNPYTQERRWYHLPPDRWSVHYNTSPDGKLFSGDGSDPIGTDELAMAINAKWIFLFRPELVPDQPGETPDQARMIRAGRLVPEKLVNLSEHDYSIEPNAQFTPDGQWLIFRSNFHGPIEVYAVEVARAK